MTEQIPVENLRIEDDHNLIRTFFEINSEYDYQLVEKILDLMVLQKETGTNTYKTLILQQRAYYQTYKHDKGVN